jgi:Nicotinamide mononucleotide transporter
MFTWIIAGMALIGTYLNVKRNRYGFALWMITNSYFSILNIRLGSYPQSALFFVYFILAVYGFIAWHRRM